MTFGRLAEYFESLEKTSSRLTLIDILAELFKEVDCEEIAKVEYLIQGRVAPFYEATEIGMAEKTIAASIAKAYELEREEVLKLYGQMGDLGLVALRLSFDKLRIAQGKLHKGSQLSVEEVFENLLEIAKTSGVGTVLKKQTILVDLLNKMDPVSAKHLVRIPLGTPRLGIGDPTVLDALAKTYGGGRENKKILEGAYNRTSDLGLIAEVLCREGLGGVEGLDVKVGRPIRPQLAERLPDAKTILEKMGGRVHIQYKYDGVRVQIHKDGDQVQLFSRNLEETTPMLPEIVAGTLKQVKAKTAILDAEALAYNLASEEFLPFQETAKRRRKYKIEEMAKSLPLKAFVFDVMYVNGKSLMGEPLEKRMEILKKVVVPNEVLVQDQVLIPEPGEFTEKLERLEEMFSDALTKGLEGLLVKRPDCLYEAGGRNFNWVKLKRHSAGELRDTIDCVILGYIYGRGKRVEFGAGALLVGLYDADKDEFVTISKIGTGLSDEEWREIHQRADKIKVDRKPARVNSILEPSVWITPEIVIEVLADEITRSPVHTAGLRQAQAKVKEGEAPAGYALRFPRLVRFREDKRAEDSTTVKELIEMFKLQYKSDQQLTGSKA